VAGKSKSEASRGAQLGRYLVLVRHLVKGKALDRGTVAKLVGCTGEMADRHMRELKKHWPELDESHPKGRRVLRLVRPRGGIVHDSVAIAASFGASLSRLFDGSNYEPGLRTAQAEVVARVRDPKLFANFDRKFYFVQRGGEIMLPDNSGILDDLIDAVLHHHFATLTYTRFDGSHDTVTIKPLSIATCDHQLYVVGRDDDGRDHPYRFSRITAADSDVTTFSYPTKAEYDPDQLFEKSLGVFVGEKYAVREIEIRLARKWATFAKFHRWHRTQRVDDTHTAHVTVTMTVRLCPELTAWVLGFGEEAEVIAPIELRNEVARRTAAAAEVYAPR
jgi:hypothetical protein